MSSYTNLTSVLENLTFFLPIFIVLIIITIGGRGVGCVEGSRVGVRSWL